MRFLVLHVRLEAKSPRRYYYWAKDVYTYTHSVFTLWLTGSLVVLLITLKICHFLNQIILPRSLVKLIDLVPSQRPVLNKSRNVFYRLLLRAVSTRIDLTGSVPLCLTLFQNLKRQNSPHQERITQLTPSGARMIIFRSISRNVLPLEVVRRKKGDWG